MKQAKKVSCSCNGTRVLTIGVLILLSLCGCASKIGPENVMVVTGFDLPSYLGTWYEIARIDNRFEKNLMEVTATYSLNDDGTVRVENKGYNTKKEKPSDIVGKARLRGDSDEGALEVSFFGPFYSDYNIIALDADYQYALVSGATFDYLWLLSRTPTIPDNVRDEYLAVAKSIGYNTDTMVWIEHK